MEYLEDHRPQDILHRYELRAVIEGYAARLAARNMTGWQIEELRVRAERTMAAKKTADRETRREASQAFHNYLLANCGNPLLGQVWESYHLQPVVPRSAELEMKILGGIPDERAHNERLMRTVEAIAAHDPDEAERTMRDYVREITEAIRRVVTEEGISD